MCIGVDYAGTEAELRGPVNDALRWTELITTRFDFPKANVLTMIDEYPSGEPVEDDDPSYSKPTKEGILEALDWLVDDVVEGDCVLFTFSGHATQVPDYMAPEDERLDEALCPMDWEQFEWGVIPQRLITDDVLHSYFAKLPPGVLLTVVLDAAFAAPPMRVPMQIDFEFPDRELENEPVTQGEYQNYRFRRDAWLRNQHVNALPRRLPVEPSRPLWSRLMRHFTRETAAPLQEGLAVFCITSCRGSQTGLDACLEGVAQGVLTYCLLRALEQLHFRCTYLELCEAAAHIAMDLRIEVMPTMNQFFQLAYGKNAGPDECRVLDPTSGFVAKDKARRRRGQRFRMT